MGGMGLVSLRERGVDGADRSSPDAVDVLDSVDCCEASFNPATPSGPLEDSLADNDGDSR